MVDPERLSVSVDRFRDLLNEQELEGPTRQFLQALRDLEVVIEPGQRSWELLVELDDEPPPSDELRVSLEQRIREEIPSLEKLLLTCRPLPDQDIEDWILSNWSSLKKYLTRLMPAGGSILEYSRVRMSGDSLCIEVAGEELKTICRNKNLVEVINQWVTRRYGSCPPVEFTVGDFTDEIEEDAETFRQETRREIAEEHRRREHRARKRDEKIIIGDVIENDATPMSELSDSGEQTVTLEGQVIEQSFQQTGENKKNLVSGVLTDRTDSFGYKVFVNGTNNSLTGLEGEWVRMRGRLQRDDYTRNQDLVLFADDINRRPPMIRDDTADVKRVELHLHSRMSQLDGLDDVEQLIERAAYWDHPALAVTDHGVAHSFPEAARAAEEYGVKLIYGVEGYLVEDENDLQATSNHVILLAVDRQGLRNLYRLISQSHVDHFYRNPKMFRRNINENRTGLLVGSACEAGEILQSVIGGDSDETIKDLMEFYDYVEIQPVGNNKFMLGEDGPYESINTIEDLREINRKTGRRDRGRPFHRRGGRGLP